ncbi:oxidoreductase [Wilcoxina mikolae CBS 423.85]|nr:oxidoreductase [Wilcoxina mikolae CBS 423.85]
MDSIIDDAVSQFGRLDCAVNCAGIDCASSPLATTTTAEFDRVNQVNYRGVFFALRAQLRVMAAQEPRDEERGERGSIVNISSVAGVMSSPGLVAYGASKHAVIGMTKTAAMDHGKDGIRVNAVCPGFIETPLTEKMLANEVMKKFACSVALRRVAVPEEVADPVLFLTSPAASFITGASLMIDGGYTLSK